MNSRTADAERAARVHIAKRRIRRAMPLQLHSVLLDVRDAWRNAKQPARTHAPVRHALVRLYPAVGVSHVPSATRPELKVFSQFGEDGWLLQLFAVIGTTTGTFLEIGAGHGRECNSANLALNFGWQGVMIDGDPRNISLATRFFSRFPDAHITLLSRYVTAENVNVIVADTSLPAEIDLLSIDIDGMDYWIWANLSATLPRVVVIEYNEGLGIKDVAVTPYEPQFDRFHLDRTGLRYGASLGALVQLGRQKGYVLVGCSAGVNAFFVRADLALGSFEPLDPLEAHEASVAAAADI